MIELYRELGGGRISEAEDPKFAAYEAGSSVIPVTVLPKPYSLVVTSSKKMLTLLSNYCAQALCQILCIQPLHL